MSTVKPRPVAEANDPGTKPESFGNKLAIDRGMAQAHSQELQNARGALAAKISNLRVATLERDLREATRSRYDRAHDAAVKAAQRVASITGEKIAVPKWLAPPAQTEEEMIDVLPVSGAYREGGPRNEAFKGMQRPDGTIIEGTAADTEWLK